MGNFAIVSLQGRLELPVTDSEVQKQKLTVKIQYSKNTKGSLEAQQFRGIWRSLFFSTRQISQKCKLGINDSRSLLMAGCWPGTKLARKKFTWRNRAQQMLLLIKRESPSTSVTKISITLVKCNGANSSHCFFP